VRYCNNHTVNNQKFWLIDWLIDWLIGMLGLIHVDVKNVSRLYYHVKNIVNIIKSIGYH